MFLFSLSIFQALASLLFLEEFELEMLPVFGAIEVRGQRLVCWRILTHRLVCSQSLAALPSALTGDIHLKLNDNDGITRSPDWFVGRDDAPPPLNCPAGITATTFQYEDDEDYVAGVARKETICDVHTPAEPAALLAFKASGDPSAWPASPSCTGTDGGRYDETDRTWIPMTCDLDAATDGTAECPLGCKTAVVPEGWTAAESASVCEWAGVECAGARVTGLSMSHWRGSMTWLSGDISLLAGLPELRKINLYGTSVSGSVEPLAALTHFDLAGSTTSG